MAPSRPNLTDSERLDIIHRLLKGSHDGVLPRGLLALVAGAVGRDAATVSRIWARYNQSVDAGEIGDACGSRMKGNVGRHRLDRESLRVRIKAVPLEDRGTVSRLAEVLGVSRTLVASLEKDGDLHHATSRIKPSLTDRNKIRRVMHCLAFLDENSLLFDGMFDMVHVDEKWFNADKDARSYLLLDGEEPPARARRSKRFIPKTMFLAASARPRADPDRDEDFDGKIGIWPLTEEYTAQRSSPNRPKGTVCTRNVESVDRTLYKHYIICNVIPAIKAKWPVSEKWRVVLIQQDNATPHVSPFDPDVVAVGTSDGWNIRLWFQPPNSPDLNVLDLGFFASIQAIQYRREVPGIDGLVTAVVEAYAKTPVNTVENIFLTLQKVMECILQAGGGNTYALPHVGKAKLRNNGELPVSFTCDRGAFETGCRMLEEAGEPMLF